MGYRRLLHGIDVLDSCPGSLEALLHGIDVLDGVIRIGPIKKGSGWRIILENSLTNGSLASNVTASKRRNGPPRKTEGK